MSSIASRIAAADDAATADVYVPEWDVTVQIVSPTVGERQRFFAADRDDNSGLIFDILVMLARDPETGDPAFTAADVEMLKNKNARAFERLASAAYRAFRVDEEAIEEGKGDSGTGQTSDTPSGSPEPSA